MLKIIRKDSLGTYSWDSSTSVVNNGYGINEWSEANLMYALKKYSGDTSITSKCGDSDCPNWPTLNLEAQSMIEEVTWNTGTMDVPFDKNRNLITPGYRVCAKIN